MHAKLGRMPGSAVVRWQGPPTFALQIEHAGRGEALLRREDREDERAGKDGGMQTEHRFPWMALGTLKTLSNSAPFIGRSSQCGFI